LVEAMVLILSLGVIEDAKYKRQDALKGLAEAAAKMVKEHGGLHK
jgi:hypothetical protein